MACYIRHGFTYRLLECSQIKSINETEFLLIEINLQNNQRLLLASVYRRPGGKVLTDFLEIFHKYIHIYTNVIIAGDLNSDLLSDGYYASHLRNLITENALFLVPFGPTHHRDSTDTWLDVIITDSESKVKSYNKSTVPFINCHDYLKIEYKFEKLVNENIKITSRDFRNTSSILFSNDLIACTHDVLSSSTDVLADVDLLFQEFQAKVKSILDVHAPYTTRYVRNRSLPWMSKELVNKCKLRNQLYDKARSTKNDTLLTEYKLVRKNLKREINLARVNYLLKALSEAPNQMKSWDILKKFGLAKTRPSSPLHIFTADELIDYYSSVTSCHANCTAKGLEDILKIPLKPTIPVFSFSPVDRVEVHQTMLTCSPKAIKLNLLVPHSLLICSICLFLRPHILSNGNNR